MATTLSARSHPAVPDAPRAAEVPDTTGAEPLWPPPPDTPAWRVFSPKGGALAPVNFRHGGAHLTLDFLADALTLSAANRSQEPVLEKATAGALDSPDVRLWRVAEG